MSALAVVNPANEAVIRELPRAGVEELDAAVREAWRSFPAWSRVAPADRARLLRAIALGVEAQAEELARTESLNVGKPVTDARAEVALVAELFHYYAGAIDKVGGRTIPVEGGVAMTFREPLGVVGLITPWNFPLAIASWKLAPALASGNTVVLKPAELTPLTALMLERIGLDAGLPEGVLKVVVGQGRVVGQRLVEHPDVARIGFTGSTAVGRGVMEAAAGTVKRITLELGGKSANVVFADADLEQAAAHAPNAVFGNAGQDCCARSRILVERRVFERFLELFVAATESYRVGDPGEETTQMGPLISAGQRQAVATYVPEQVTYRHPLPEQAGYWFPPTILAEIAASEPAAREEIFGPVAVVLPFDDEADAVRLANDTPYGLSGSVWTGDGGRALRMARALECGAISINSNTSVRVATPFGGFKQSGLGRELGLAGMEANSELKTVFYSTAADGVTMAQPLPLTRMRRAITKAMTLSATVPQFAIEMVLDTSLLGEARAQLPAGARPSYTDALVASAAQALRAHAGVNASFSDEGIIEHDDVNIGLATAIEGGLISPVIAHADRRTIVELSGERRRVVEAAHAGTLTPAELLSATFTISNLGPFGVTRFTALVVPPEAAILAVGTLQEETIVLVLSADHRVVDGAPAALFLRQIKEQLEDADWIARLFSDERPTPLETGEE